MSTSVSTALVTGATGFLGARLAETLCRQGCRVRAMARRTSDLARLAGLGVEVVQGELEDEGSVARACAGQHLVFHCAARVTDWAPRAELARVNVDGTRAVIAACQAAGVARLVHTSSLTVLGLPRDRRRVDETTPLATPPVDPYTDSKIEGERLVRAAHGAGGLETTVVRPGVIWGPGDPTVLPRIAALLERGRMVRIGGGGNVVATTHVANLAEGMVLAARAGAAGGQVYHVLDGEQLTAGEVVDALAAALGARPPRLSLPFAAVYGLALASEAVARLGRRATPPALTRYGVRLVACDCRYDTDKARRELGYRPGVTFAAGVAELAEGWRQEGGAP